MTKLNDLTKNLLTLLILLSFFLSAFTAQLQAKVVNPLTPEAFSELHQCDKSFEYDIYFFDRNVGYLQRTIKWDNSAAAAKATVTSYGEVNFLWLGSTYQQQSSMRYSTQYNQFLTPSF